MFVETFYNILSFLGNPTNEKVIVNIISRSVYGVVHKETCHFDGCTNSATEIYEFMVYNSELKFAHTSKEAKFMVDYMMSITHDQLITTQK